jgi:hypothetical protein
MGRGLNWHRHQEHDADRWRAFLLSAPDKRTFRERLRCLFFMAYGHRTGIRSSLHGDKRLGGST